MTEPVTPLSASRIKTAQSCSWLYWCKYKLNLPDASNDGAKRGSICHLIFELLGEPKRKSIYKKILYRQDVFAVPSIKRLIYKHAKKVGVDDEENIESIKEMTLNGLKYDFYGESFGKPTEAISEKDFEIVCNEEDRRYKIKGFIDKLFLYKKNKFALIRDFKSSKQKFKGKEVSDNLQDYMYSLAIKHIYPEYKNRQSEFLFLKFGLDEQMLEKSEGVIRMNIISDDDLEGFEYQLSGIQEYLDNFSESDAMGNLAARQKYPTDNSFGGPLQCGMGKYQGQLKKDGTVMWHCPMRYPFGYFLIYKDDVMVKSIFDHEREESEKQYPQDAGYVYKKMEYKGCPHYHPQNY